MSDTGLSSRRGVCKPRKETVIFIQRIVSERIWLDSEGPRRQFMGNEAGHLS